MSNEPTDFENTWEQADAPDGKYILSLYITGATPKSTRAIANIKAICDEYLNGHYELEVIDLYQQPEMAQQASIIAAPTLVKTLPTPLRKLVGDMSDETRVLAGLGLRKKT
jgi:circadian clock protein KaiB